MGSGLSKRFHASAQDWGQVLTFEGKNCSLFGAFTKQLSQERIGPDCATPAMSDQIQQEFHDPSCSQREEALHSLKE